MWELFFNEGFSLNTRTLICTAAGLLAVAFLILLAPRQPLLPKGIVLPAQQTRAPISPDQVTIYRQPPQQTFTSLGSMSVEFGFNTLNAKTKTLFIQKIKQMAANAGANGVIIRLLMPYNGLRQMLIFRGIAIDIPPATRGTRT